MTTEDTTEDEIPMFSDFLSSYKNGSVDAELTAMFREVVTAVTAQRKKGSVSFSITVAPPKGMDDKHLFVVVEKLDSKVPQETRGTAFYYGTDKGDLVKNDPRQGGLFDNQESNQ